MPVYVKLVLVKRTEKVRNIRLFLGTIIYLGSLVGMAKAAYIECLNSKIRLVFIGHLQAQGRVAAERLESS